MWRWSILFLALGALAGPAWAGGRPLEPRGPLTAVVPFENVTGRADALRVVMERVWSELEGKGFRLTGNGRVEAFLRRRRIRARNALNMTNARDLAKLLDARYVLLGTVDAWAVNGGPEVGLSARLVDPERGVTVWSGAISLHAVRVPGVLALGRPRTLEAASKKAARRLFRGLVLRRHDGAVLPAAAHRRARRRFLADRPVFYRNPAFHGTGLRVAILPFHNSTGHACAPPVVGDHVVSWLISLDGVEVVDPGELRRVLIEEDIQPIFGLDKRKMKILADRLDVDAILDGTVLRYENGKSPEPKIDLYARLRDVRSGRVLWSATTSREGFRTRTIYDYGRIRGMDRLADEAVRDLLSTWVR